MKRYGMSFLLILCAAAVWAEEPAVKVRDFAYLTAAGLVRTVYPYTAVITADHLIWKKGKDDRSVKYPYTLMPSRRLDTYGVRIRVGPFRLDARSRELSLKVKSEKEAVLKLQLVEASTGRIIAYSLDTVQSSYRTVALPYSLEKTGLYFLRCRAVSPERGELLLSRLTLPSRTEIEKRRDIHISSKAPFFSFKQTEDKKLYIRYFPEAETARANVTLMAHGETEPLQRRALAPSSSTGMTTTMIDLSESVPGAYTVRAGDVTLPLYIWPEQSSHHESPFGAMTTYAAPHLSFLSSVSIKRILPLWGLDYLFEPYYHDGETLAFRAKKNVEKLISSHLPDAVLSATVHFPARETTPKKKVKAFFKKLLKRSFFQKQTTAVYLSPFNGRYHEPLDSRIIDKRLGKMDREKHPLMMSGPLVDLLTLFHGPIAKSCDGVMVPLWSFSADELAEAAGRIKELHKRFEKRLRVHVYGGPEVSPGKRIEDYIYEYLSLFHYVNPERYYYYSVLFGRRKRINAFSANHLRRDTAAWVLLHQFCSRYGYDTVRKSGDTLIVTTKTQGVTAVALREPSVAFSPDEQRYDIWRQPLVKGRRYAFYYRQAEPDGS